MENYFGYKEIVVDNQDEKWASLYSEPKNNIFDCNLNEYVSMQQLDGNSDIFKWTQDGYKKLTYKAIDSYYVGKVKPRNPQQIMAFDLLQDPKTTIKVITGRFGSGKTFLMVVNALHLIEQQRFKKIVWVRNNQAVKDTKDIGALPGDTFQKILPFVMPFADHVGGEIGVETLMKREILEVQHLGFIRGRDIKDSIIICSEAENLTKQHVQLLIGRVGEGSNLWLDGDCKQTDAKVFEDNSGLKIAIEKLAGNKLFGYVHLQKSERSETSALADLLD